MVGTKIIATLLAFSIAAHAKQLFRNTGTLTGWDGPIKPEHNGKVEQVTDVVYEGSTALRMTQVYDSSGKYNGRYHSEVKKDNVYKRGDTGFYGFAFQLQKDWQSSPAQSYNIAQFIADFSDYKCDDFIPSSMVWVIGDKLYTRVKYGEVCSPKTKTYDTKVTVTPGAWHKIVIQASWKSDNTGFYKMWVDGKKVVEDLGQATTLNDNRAFQFRVGLYANGWHDDKTMKGTQGTRKVWLDEIAAGDTFADADPDQWKKSESTDQLPVAELKA